MFGHCEELSILRFRFVFSLQICNTFFFTTNRAQIVRTNKHPVLEFLHCLVPSIPCQNSRFWWLALKQKTLSGKYISINDVLETTYILFSRAIFGKWAFESLLFFKCYLQSSSISRFRNKHASTFMLCTMQWPMVWFGEHSAWPGTFKRAKTPLHSWLDSPVHVTSSGWEPAGSSPLHGWSQTAGEKSFSSACFQKTKLILNLYK